MNHFLDVAKEVPYYGSMLPRELEELIEREFEMDEPLSMDICRGDETNGYRYSGWWGGDVSLHKMR